MAYNIKVRAIGISNFYPDRFIDLQEHVEIKPDDGRCRTDAVCFLQWKQPVVINQ